MPTANVACFSDIATTMQSVEALSGKGPNKNYGKNKLQDETFFIKGPMGRGLEVEKTGLHVAFAAGTGALVFLDIVSHLMLRNAIRRNKIKSKDALASQAFDYFDDGFVFHFYAAFQNEEQAIGLELC